jgi:hypothetical protein
MEQMMSCPSCGMPSTGPRFCRECGSRLLGGVRPPVQPARTARQGLKTLALFNSSDLRHLSDAAGKLDGTVAVAIFGTITGNLTSQTLPLGETKITLSTIFGSAKLVLAPGVAVKVTGLSLFSGVKIRGKHLCDGLFNSNGYETPGYSQASRRLHIEATTIFGDLKIK